MNDIERIPLTFYTYPGVSFVTNDNIEIEWSQTSGQYAEQEKNDILMHLNA